MLKLCLILTLALIQTDAFEIGGDCNYDFECDGTPNGRDNWHCYVDHYDQFGGGWISYTKLKF